MTCIADIIARKGSGIVAIAPTATLREAARAMFDLGIGSLVVGSASEPQGLISERDLVHRLAIDNNASEARVEQIMGPTITVAGSDEMAHALALMTDSRARHLLVRDDDGIIGLISIGDLVKTQRDEQRQALNELDQYLHDRPSVIT